MMNKKILLTALATTMLVTNNVNAQDINVSYKGNNKFVYNDKNYDSFQALYTIIGRILKSNPGVEMDIKVKDDEKIALFLDISQNVNGLKTDFSFYAQEYYNKSHEEVESLLNYAKDTYAGLSDEQKYFFLNAIEINHIVQLKEKQFKDTIDYVKNNVATENTISQTGIKFTASAKQINDANIQKLIPEMQALFAKERSKNPNDWSSPTDKARQKELVKIIYGRPELNSLRNSPANQELLKNYIENLKVGAQIDNKYIKDVIDQKTQQLIAYLDIFLVSDVKDASTVPSVQKSDTAVTDGIMNSHIATRDLIDSRINGFSATAPAAGDWLQSYGVWVQGSFTSATQKAYKNAPGYKSSQAGATIGADIGDDILLGIAYSYFKNDIKNKNTQSNKEDIKSNFFTAYAKCTVTDDIFLKGQGQYGISDIKKTRATGDLANNLAKAKTKANLMAGKLEVGYDLLLSTPVHIIPTIGASYADVKVKAYNESGAGLNRSISKRNARRISGLAGVSVNYDAYAYSAIKLMPEIHANIDYAFSTKNSATIVKIFDGIDPIATPSEKSAKAYFNVGTSLKAFQTDKFEVSAGYDLGLAKKFQSHTGTVKVRVNM